MSGIAGIYYLGERPVGEQLDRMIGAMEHRGPDGINTWRDGSVGFGHCMMHTTPESVHETQPLVRERGRLVLAADARIDNRDELISALRPTKSKDRPITDAELILAAYEQWGMECPKQIRGAFAFVIWDNQKRRLFCARDHFGVKPFYYYQKPNRFFALGTEISALCSVDDIPIHPNYSRVADYLCSIEFNQKYTFYEDIFRLPPGHHLVMSSDGLSIQQYWQLSPSEEREFDSDSKYATAFRELFVNSVQSRLRSPSPSGAYLSGGLDSSSIVSTARFQSGKEKGQALKTFTGVVDDLPEANERDYVDSVLDKYEVDHHFANVGGYNPADDIMSIVDANSEPTRSHIFSMSWRISKYVRDKGVRVMLCGSGGDEVVSHGHYYVSELARRNEWWKVFKELDDSLENLKYFFKLWVKFGFLPSKISGRLLKVLNRKTKKRLYPWRFILRSNILEKFDIRERWEESTGKEIKSPTHQTHHYRTLASPLQAGSLEELNQLTATYGVEQRFPFWDLTLVKYCLSLPVEQKRRNGMGRYVLRNAMSGILPEKVRTRRTKADFTGSVVRSTVKHSEDIIQLSDNVSDYLAPIVNKKEFNRLSKNICESDSNHPDGMVHFFHRLLMLGYWMKKVD